LCAALIFETHPQRVKTIVDDWFSTELFDRTSRGNKKECSLVEEGGKQYFNLKQCKLRYLF
jgi:hypothetical protein